jgi:hypothetical protein
VAPLYPFFEHSVLIQVGAEIPDARAKRFDHSRGLLTNDRVLDAAKGVADDHREDMISGRWGARQGAPPMRPADGARKVATLQEHSEEILDLVPLQAAFDYSMAWSSGRRGPRKPRGCA